VEEREEEREFEHGVLKRNSIAEGGVARLINLESRKGV